MPKKIDQFWCLVLICILPRAAEIAKLAGILKTSSEFSVVIIPTATNSLGVSLICDLDETCDGYCVGYNEEADFVLTSLSGESNETTLAMPALNQQEGTIVSVDKRVVVLNAALGFDGYELNDILNALDIGARETIDWTRRLPLSKGFKGVKFDDLPNNFGNDGSCNIGYVVDSSSCETKAVSFVKPDESVILGGTVVYASNPVLQFNDFTAKCSQIASENDVLRCSAYFAQGHELSNGDSVTVAIDGAAMKLKVAVDTKLIGSLSMIPTFASNSGSAKAYAGKFAFQNATLTKG